MRTTDVKKHVRKGKNKASVVRKHSRKSLTHRTKDGKRQVFVDGFWKHDDFGDGPKAGWSYERLMKEKLKLSEELNKGLYGQDILPNRKFGLLTRRLKKINRLLKRKK